ncbi:General alpha-glucoside permease [Cyphellophora attinorum]|uniref:General alpha-glucoside permease n=1 Tax=Cyphellophora attinorum TaxID=1664694 RepID=A0A0N0NLJ5_9EURO|nr:General alpha-glucoside permease [Phialophora attinorum]KPI39381.1 General alpha-glucoside permease [Phialophora attinorum]
MSVSIEAKQTPFHDEVAEVDTPPELTPWQCLKANPKIVLWTLYANIGSTMVGYENLALSVCLAMPAFQMTFASEVNGVLIIPAYWQSLWNALYNIFNMLGSVSAGHLQDWFGRRSVFLAAIIIGSAGVAVSYISKTPAEFLGGKIVAGYAVGLLLAGTQTYVSEIAPLPMRGLALSTNTVMLNLGLLIGISATFSRVSIMDQSAFRVVFAAAWAFPALLAAGLAFMPESPYWLVMKDKHDAALVSLRRLSRKGENLDARLAEIQATVEAERRMRIAFKNSGLVEIFKGTNLRRTCIILICMYMPQIVGAVLSANAPYFLSQTGLPSHTVLMLVQVAVSVGLVSALINIVLMMRFRHRPLMFLGVSICVVMYLIMGIASALPRSSATLTVIGVATAFTSISYGPAVGASMAVAGEVSAANVRAKSLGVGQAFSSFASVVWTIVLPYLFNQDEANLGGKIGWIFFGMAVVYFGLMYFFVPGTKDRTFEELDIMFERRISARRFEKYQLNETSA